MDKIAWLHFDYITKSETENLPQITAGIHAAAEKGARYILTPELAVQGYHFTQQGKPYVIHTHINALLQPVLQAAAERRVWIFLGCAVRDAQHGQPHNSCLVIDPNGSIVGRHDKHLIHAPAEAWSVAGTTHDCFNCSGTRMGVLVCADAWYDENGAALGQLGAEVIVLSAAWPPGCGGPPENAWARCSRASGGKPVLVCNQTGFDGRMDCRIAMSAVILQGKLALSYVSPQPAILLADMDFSTGMLAQNAFTVLPWEEGNR